jgi:NAD(P)-dependent dehydrogenase (short-subunit alcohol dehydrogenase family)
MELAPLGVQVVLIEPGTIRSEFAARTMSEVEDARHPRTRYAAVYARAAAMQARFARVAADPVHVTRAIRRAVEARRPAARYVAPRRFVALIALVRLLPTRLVDAAMRRGFGLTAGNLIRGVQEG